MPMQRLSRFGLLAAAALICGNVLAGPPEDYETARRAYHGGDMFAAMPLLRKSADAGYAPAQVLLGQILDASEFDEEAAVMYGKAAKQGNADGQFYLGALYSVGEGVNKDLKEAHRLIKAAADQGHVQATNVLAQAYLNSQLGIPESERESADALFWVKAAVANDFLPAIDALAQAYRTGGFGLTADPKEADRLAAKANAIRNIQANAGKGKKRR